jgi:hypothetical protein
VSSLYRCRARVGYRPAKSSKLIVFDERQIQELNVKLKWQPNKGFASADKSTEASAATSALDQSTCSVTISDPYLTGLAWPALFDAAMLYTQASVSAANNIILPACEEGQDPIVDKCAKSYVDTEVDSTVDQGGIYPFLLLSLWYDVKGTSFGTDFYFRVSGFSVSHGTRYPSVTIRGVEARSVIFNQSLINTTLEEGVDIDKTLKDLAEKQGFSVSFCANTNTDPSKKRLLPRSVRYTGITTDEAIKKVLGSVNGNLLSMPTREYANKISMCSRGEVNQGCSIFYLGKGLYEGYEISGQPDLTVEALNSEIGGNANNADPYVSEAFKASTYTLGNITPNKRKKAMEKVKKLAFPELFKPTPAHIKNAAVTTGYVWRDAGPVVINEEATKVEKSGLNLFGIAPNGTTAISFFNGEVVEADSKNGRVDIKTKWSLQICEKGGSQKCFFRPIHQESSGLATVKIKAKDKVAISQEIGTSTTDKPEFVKFYIVGHGSARVTLNPQIVWDWAFPEEELPKPATPAISSNPANNTEKTRAAGAAATTQSNGAAPDSGGAGTVVGRVGSTGKSSGPHVHIQESTSKTLSESQLRTLAAKYVTVSGKSLTSYPQGDGFGAGRNHGGLDYPIKEGEPISVTGKIIAAGAGVGGGDCGNGLAFQPPEGPELLICHLMDKSIPPNIAGLTTSSGGGKTKPTIQGSPAAQGLMLETGFKGVPRALRIIPGRTILSMITNYDEWVEENRPTSIDPGVWIPKRFKNWFVSECDYRWRDGDLRVQIEGVSAWGNTQVSAPTFDNYIKGLKDTGDIKITNTYYDYIRSLGGLNWITEDGKDSTEVHCKEAQELSQALSEGSDSTTPADSSGSFPASGCKTGDPNKDAIINGLYSAGLKTKNALAGALGNMTRESGLNSNVHNGSSPGTGCSTTPSRILGRTGYGLVQWCGSRADELATKYSCGRNCSLTQQLSFLQYEFGKDYKTMVSELNNAKSAGDAADIFMRKFERPKYPDQEEPGRRKLGEEIVKQIKCDKPA